MRNVIVIAVVSASLVLSACERSVADVGAAASATAPAEEVEKPTASSSVEATSAEVRADTRELASQLSEGMAYVDLRTAALAAGWLPVQDYECPEKTGGEAIVCRELPELEACSSDGRCSMWFGHDGSGSMLRVDAFGDHTKWKVAGDAALLRVRAWDFSEVESGQAKGAPAPASAACPAEDFQGFLQAFAADNAVQEAFTQPLVKVMQYREIEGESDTYPALLSADDYDGFRFEHEQDGFHVVHADGKVDPTATPFKVTETSDGGYSVSYEYGMSEGNTYLFARQKGCWYLTAEPQPPSP